VTLPDNHVHSQFSWDATRGDMDATCRRALELGLPSIAFTEHVDWVRGEKGVLDVPAYFDCIERCRAAYPGLRILSGVEMGEPHLFGAEARALLQAPFERVLASVHCVNWEGREVDASKRGFLTARNADSFFRLYLERVLQLVQGDWPFEVLAHLDYPKRYWPAGATLDVTRYEDEFRTILGAAAARGLVLELNTTRNEDDPGRYLCPGPTVLEWWREEGGPAISFGSDAHSPDQLGVGFRHSRAVAEAAGFRGQDDPSAYWVR
jgi:histidinol-phosphatase (PHP family)